jgi:hypothetical protein
MARINSNLGENLLTQVTKESFYPDPVYSRITHRITENGFHFAFRINGINFDPLVDTSYFQIKVNYVLKQK